MNFDFIHLFKDIPFKSIHIYPNLIKPISIKFDTITYDYIMKDDSFKKEILNQLKKSSIDKSELLNKLNDLTCRILTDYFKDKFTIRNFYVNRNVDDCIAFVKSHSFYEEKKIFLKKMFDIANLFPKKTKSHSLKYCKKADSYIFKCDDNEEETKEELLDCEYLNCDILLEKCDIASIPIKKCHDNVWYNNKILTNPFRVLESDKLIRRIVNLVEPYSMDYKKTYTRFQTMCNENISPFTRDDLIGAYLLHNDTIDIKAMMKHNNYILSTLFQNRLPNNPILWHMIFLYIMAMYRFEDKKAILFKEIQFLGEHAKDFITLNPHLNPPIIESLNCCFWYLAHVCHKVFPNSEKNILRNADFISGVFLEFYQQVYEENYIYPAEMARWQLWYKLTTKKDIIFSILSHYYYYEKIENVKDKKQTQAETGQAETGQAEIEELQNPFRIILYRKTKHSNLKSPQIFKSLYQLSIKDVLNIYALYLRNQKQYENLRIVKEKNIVLYDNEDEGNLMDHIEINLATCHPFVRCPVTKKHWKSCIGNFNQLKHSYLLLFRRYCEKYKEYPQNAENLMYFLNKYIYKKQNNIPEVFSLSLKEKMKKVMDIFKEVRNTYSCSEYLKHFHENCSEAIREDLDKKQNTMKNKKTFWNYCYIM